MPHEVIIFTCFTCNTPSQACPECVNTIRIDPETKLPPDVQIVDGRYAPIIPLRSAMERSEKQPLCDECVNVARHSGKTELVTSEERHRTTHAPRMGV